MSRNTADYCCADCGRTIATRVGTCLECSSDVPLCDECGEPLRTLVAQTLGLCIYCCPDDESDDGGVP